MTRVISLSVLTFSSFFHFYIPQKQFISFSLSIDREAFPPSIHNNFIYILSFHHLYLFTLPSPPVSIPTQEHPHAFQESCFRSFLFYFLFQSVFICLNWVLVVARGIFIVSCGICTHSTLTLIVGHRLESAQVSVDVACELSSWAFWAPEHTGSAVTARGLRCSMAYAPQPGIKLMSPALQDEFLTTGSPGKPPRSFSKCTVLVLLIVK